MKWNLPKTSDSCSHINQLRNIVLTKHSPTFPTRNFTEVYRILLDNIDGNKINLKHAYTGSTVILVKDFLIDVLQVNNPDSEPLMKKKKKTTKKTAISGSMHGYRETREEEKLWPRYRRTKDCQRYTFYKHD